MVIALDYTTANSSEEARKEHISKIALLTRGLEETKDINKLYKRLLTEAAGSTAGRPFEFIPVTFDIIQDGINFEILSGGDRFNISVSMFVDIMKYSVCDKITSSTEKILYNIKTNMRTLLKAGIPYDKIPYNESCDGFKVLKMEIPMFVWSQLYTHTQISKLSESDRVSVKTKKDGYDFWLPEDFEYKYNERYSEENEYNEDDIKRLLFTRFSQSQVIDIFVELGYPKEIWSRAIYYMKYKTTVMAAWQSKDTWDNLLNERLNGWTQSITKDIANKIKEVLS